MTFLAIKDRQRTAIFSAIKRDKLIPTAEFPAISESAVKIATERPFCVVTPECFYSQRFSNMPSVK